MPNDECRNGAMFRPSGFGIRHSFVIRHSSFIIRYSPAGIVVDIPERPAHTPAPLVIGGGGKQRGKPGHFARTRRFSARGVPRQEGRHRKGDRFMTLLGKVLVY